MRSGAPGRPQVCAGLLVCFISTLLILQTSPYAGRRTNQLAASGHGLLFVFFVFGDLTQHTSHART